MGRAEVIHLDRVVHDQIHRHQRLDELGVLAQPRHGRAHRRQVHQQGHPGKILQDDPRNHKRDLLRAPGGGLPIGQRAHILLGHPLAVAIAQDRLQYQANRYRQPGHRADAGLLELRQRVKSPPRAFPCLEFLQRAKEIMRIAHNL